MLDLKLGSSSCTFLFLLIPPFLEFWSYITLREGWVQKTQCPLILDKLFCLWDKCEFMFTRPKDK